jgi:hypothetical protein
MPKGLVVQLEHGNGGENLQTCFACLLSGVCVCVCLLSLIDAKGQFLCL